MNGRGLEGYTTANFTSKGFQVGFGMINSPNQKAYTAQATTTLGKNKNVLLGASGAYDAKTGQGNMSLNIGVPINNGNIMLGIASTPGMHGFNFQATQALRNVGVLGFRGIYTKNSLTTFTALGLDVLLDKTFIGPISITSNYTQAGPYKAASLGIAKPIGPGNLPLSLGSWDGKAAAPEIRYSCSWSF
jgi:hypothetical protein